MFYDNYVRLCNSVNKSPSAVAMEIGIAKPTVSRWKTGSKPNHATALKVADYFGVPVSELTGEKEKAPTQEGEREIGFDDFTYAFYEESKDLPDEKKKMLLEMARFMKADIEISIHAPREGCDSKLYQRAESLLGSICLFAQGEEG